VTLRFVASELPGVVIVEPQIHRDDRGFFLESYHADKYREGGIDATFVQDNHSSSCRGTLRGLHGQSPHPQGKLVRVLEGEIFDVVVDVRRGSPAYGQFVTAVLSAENFRQIYVPPGLAHGFLVVSEVAQVEYKCTDFYQPKAEFAIAWNDPELAIPWPIDEPILSTKDAAARPLSKVQERLIDFAP
jgi:dTDP-4-dehydrorhamnose 3,5-epimerase